MMHKKDKDSNYTMEIKIGILIRFRVRKYLDKMEIKIGVRIEVTPRNDRRIFLLPKIDLKILIMLHDFMD